MTTKDLSKSECDVYYRQYIQKLSNTISLKKGMVQGKKDVVAFFEAIPLEKHNYQYAPGKWTIKEILQHLIDTERIFTYRCFRIARNDKTSLAGYDQNVYIEPSKASQKTMQQLVKEYEAVRGSSISLIESLPEEDLLRIGYANDGEMSAGAAAFITIGHEIWHIDIIKERYL